MLPFTAYGLTNNGYSAVALVLLGVLALATSGAVNVTPQGRIQTRNGIEATPMNYVVCGLFPTSKYCARLFKLPKHIVEQRRRKGKVNNNNNKGFY